MKSNKKVKFKQWKALQQFRVELGTREFNFFRSPLIVMIFILQILANFDIRLSVSLVILGLTGCLVLLWIVGYIIDFTKYYTYLDQEYYKRGNIFKKLENMDKKQ